MKAKIINLLILSFTLCMFQNCSDFTETDLPQTQLTSPVVFEDQNTATSALNYIYAQIRENGLMGGESGSFTSLFSIYSDDLNLNSNESSDYRDFSIHSVSSTNTYLNSLWANTYNIIYNLNIFLESIKQSDKLPDNYKQQVTGEALTLRAFLHFGLANTFGDIPYVISTDYRINSQIKKTNLNQIYPLITEDLQIAKSLLSFEYPSNLRTRINQSACSALLARVYLYSQQWNLAIDEATEIINTSSIYQLEELDKLFLKESSSVIWHLSPGNAGENAAEGMYFLRTAPPVEYAISESVLNAFEDGDARKTNWIKQIGTDYIPYKYKAHGNTGTSLEYTVVLRLEELYLIRAEAYAQNPSTIDKALEDLNIIRHRSGLEELHNLSQTEVLTAMYKERQIEFFTEQGHRWFDLKRTGRAANILSVLKPNWKDTDLLFPIPNKELLLNPNLNPQNDGY